MKKYFRRGDTIGFDLGLVLFWTVMVSIICFNMGSSFGRNQLISKSEVRYIFERSDHTRYDLDQDTPRPRNKDDIVIGHFDVQFILENQ